MTSTADLIVHAEAVVKTQYTNGCKPAENPNIEYSQKLGNGLIGRVSKTKSP